MAERLFLPVRRGPDILVFEYREQPVTRRWEFHAAAVQTDGNSDWVRTGVVALDDAELAHCADVAKHLAGIEAVLSAVDLTQEASYASALSMASDTAVFDQSSLLTACMYLQFVRQMLVLDASIRRYEARAPQDRFDLGLTASIYDGLVKRHELRRAEVILDGDKSGFPARIPRHREWGYLLRLAATVKERLGKPAEALEFARLAAAAAPAAGIWRRVGNLCDMTGDTGGAIDAFLRSERLEPLAAGPARRLAFWLLRVDRLDEAETWCGIAEARGAKDCQTLSARIDKARKSTAG